MNFSRRFLIKKETRKGAEDANPAHMFIPFFYINNYLSTDRNGYGCTTRGSNIVDYCTTLRRHWDDLIADIGDDDEMLVD